MPRYWVIAPVESKPPEVFDKVWKFDLANNLISIGWKGLGDVSKMSREELSEAVASTYPDKPPPTKGLYANMIWAFYHEIGPGDFVIARRGRKTLVAVGKVSQSAFYAPGKNPAHGHPNFLEVSWQEQPRDKVFPSVVFPMHTLAELSESEYHNFLDGSGTPPVTEGRPVPTSRRNVYGDFINFRGLQHAPLNEQGVVFLFGMICQELRYVVEIVKPGFPDCEAKREVRPGMWERVRIEFELRSHTFQSHGHDPDECDVIVCWEDNWPNCPIEVLELKSALQRLSPTVRPQ